MVVIYWIEFSFSGAGIKRWYPQRRAFDSMGSKVVKLLFCTQECYFVCLGG